MTVVASRPELPSVPAVNPAPFDFRPPRVPGEMCVRDLPMDVPLGAFRSFADSADDRLAALDVSVPLDLSSDPRHVLAPLGDWLAAQVPATSSGRSAQTPPLSAVTAAMDVGLYMAEMLRAEKGADLGYVLCPPRTSFSAIVDPSPPRPSGTPSLTGFSSAPRGYVFSSFVLAVGFVYAVALAKHSARYIVSCSADPVDTITLPPPSPKMFVDIYARHLGKL